MNKKGYFFMFSLCFVLLLGACSQADPKELTPVVYDSSEISGSDVVIADGEIMPVKDVDLVVKSNGVIEEILIQEGQIIRAGETIFRLEDQKFLQADLEKAELEKQTAQQALDDMFLFADIEKNQAYQQVLSARSRLNQVQADWDNFDEDAYEDDLDNANEEIADAKQSLDDAQDDLADYLDLDSDNATRQNREDAVERAELDLNQAQRDRDTIKINYDQVRLAVDLAEAELETAEAAYAKFNQGPDQDQLNLAMQRLAAATAQVAAIQTAITDLDVTAPFEGTVVSIKITEGEFVHAGQIVGLIADFSTWYVETTDLTELEVTRINAGDLVRISVDAFPNETFTGVVTQIKEYAEINYSDVTYPVRIEVDPTDLALRWKMSVIVTFEK